MLVYMLCLIVRVWDICALQRTSCSLVRGLVAADVSGQTKTRNRGWLTHAAERAGFSQIVLYSTFCRMAKLTTIVSDEQLAVIARKFLTKWEELSPSLGLTQQQEESIRRTHSDYEDQKRQSLRMWKRNKGNEATFGVFITAAEGISNMELADSVRDLMNPLQGYYYMPTLIVRLGNLNVSYILFAVPWDPLEDSSSQPPQQISGEFTQRR